jgi:cysteine desulfurase/selenocysteine lyase
MTVASTALTTDEWAAEVRTAFPFFQQSDVEPLIYFDNGATTQKPRRVIDAMSTFYETANCNVGRGVYRLSMQASDIYEGARATVTRFIGATDPRTLIFTKNATESVNLAAGAFGDQVVGTGDEVLITGMEHHSNLLPWRMLCERRAARLVVVPTDTQGRVTIEDFQRMLNPRVKMIAVAHISNVLGTVNPVAEIIEVAHRQGVPVLVDGAQAVSRRPVDVEQLDADFYAFSAHKMYGPLGVGALYVKPEHLDRMRAVNLGGGTAKGVSYEGELLLMPVPNRFEAGTPNIAGAVGMAAAADFLTDLGMDRVSAHDTEMVVTIATRLRETDNVRVLGDPARAPGGIVSFVVDGLHPYDVGNHLNSHGIAVRTGVHCAIPFLDSLGLVGTVRASFGVYNTAAEIDRLVDAMATVKAGMWTTEHPTRRFL